MMMYVLRFLSRLQKMMDHFWYLPLMGFLAGLDHYVLVFPVDGMLASHVLLAPRRWVRITFWFCLGSFAGAISLLLLTRWFDQTGVSDLLVQFHGTWAWELMEVGMSRGGLWLAFLSGVTPVPQQPAMVILGLSQVPLLQILPMYLLGRVIKMTIIAVVAAYFPQYLRRLWGLQGEIDLTRRM